MTPATKNRPPLRPTCRSNFVGRPPQGGFLSFQAEYSRYKETTRESHEAIMRSTADAVARRHRGCLEYQGGLNSWSKSWRDPHCVSSMGTKRATDENIADRKVAIARRCRNVAMTNTWSLRDGASVNSKESGAFPPHLSEKTTKKKTSRFQRVNSGVAMSVMTSTPDAAVRRHCGCLEHQGCLETWSTSWWGPHWVSSPGTERATDENVFDRKVAEDMPCPLVTATNTWRLHDGASVNSEGPEALPQHFSEKATIKKTTRLQNVNSGNIMRVVTSTADVAARRHRGCLKHRRGFNTWSTSWRSPHWVSSTGTERATDENVFDRKVAKDTPCPLVTATNTWRLHNGASVNSEEPEALPTHFSEKATIKKTTRLQNVNSGNIMRVVTSTADVSARRHRGCLKHRRRFNTWSTSWQGPHWVAITRTNCAADKNDACGKVAVSRLWRHVATTNTWRLHDGASFNSEGSQAFPQHLPEKTTKKTSRLQKGNSGDTTSVVRLTADAAARGHRGCLEHQGGFNAWSTSWWRPHWVSSMGHNRAAEENVADWKVAEARPCPHVVATNTWRLHDGASVNSERSEAFPPHFSEKATNKKTSRLQSLNSSNILRVMTWTADAAARRHRGCLKHRGCFNAWSTWQRGPPHFSEKATIKKTSRLQNVNSCNIMRVVMSTADAAARRHRGCLKHRGGFNIWSTSWRGTLLGF
ncbi:hypothetical protein MRX96_013802 [Rhipicephalus microplus]